MKSSTDKTVLVTGASSGIGLTIAASLARRGADVILTARSTETLNNVAADIRKTGVNAHVFPEDLSQPGAAGLDLRQRQHERWVRRRPTQRGRDRPARQNALPAPNDTPGVGLFSNSDGTYSHLAGDACPGFGFAGPPLCLATPLWSFDWSVNTNWDGSNPALTLGQLKYQLGMDADPGPGTDFTLFDPITPSLIAPAFDHAIGDNATTTGNGDTAVINYLTNIGSKNVAQNSWNYEFFNNLGTSLASFDPSVD